MTNKPKRGRPAGTKKLTEELKSLAKFNVELIDEQVKLHKEIKNLNHQIIGYKAVIDYLEFQITKFNK